MCSNVFFAPEILADVCLVDDDNMRGVEVSALGGGLHADAEAEGDVRDGEDDDSNVGGRVLGDPREVSLEDMVTVEEGLLTVGLDPYLELGVLGQVVQTGDVQLEFTRLSELAETGARTDQLVLTDVRSHLQHLRVYVVHAVFVQSKHILTVLTVYQKLYVTSQKLCQLSKESLRLVLRQRPHFIIYYTIYYYI